MKRKATAMWSRSSSSCDNVNDEARYGRGLSEAEEEEVAAAAAAENRAGTLTEPLRMSERHRPNYAELDGGRRTTPSQTVTTSRELRDVAWYRPTRVTMARCPRLCLR